MNSIPVPIETHTLLWDGQGWRATTRGTKRQPEIHSCGGRRSPVGGRIGMIRAELLGRTRANPTPFNAPVNPPLRLFLKEK